MEKKLKYAKGRDPDEEIWNWLNPMNLTSLSPLVFFNQLFNFGYNNISIIWQIIIVVVVQQTDYFSRSFPGMLLKFERFWSKSDDAFKSKTTYNTKNNSSNKQWSMLLLLCWTPHDMVLNLIWPLLRRFVEEILHIYYFCPFFLWQGET